MLVMQVLQTDRLLKEFLLRLTTQKAKPYDERTAKSQEQDRNGAHLTHGAVPGLH